MENNAVENQRCIIVGASHAGVNCAFALRKEGWEGDIVLYDKEPNLPYHRPPLSKGYLTGSIALDGNLLRPESAYEKEKIALSLGVSVTSINRSEQEVLLSNGKSQLYTKLILATGGRPIIPTIKGLKEAKNYFVLRTAKDALAIKENVLNTTDQKIVVIGGGYIGLEVAASLAKKGAKVTILEREERILARVTAETMSNYFEELHARHGVVLETQKNVIQVQPKTKSNIVCCEDGSTFKADIIILGVGIYVNDYLAANSGITIENGIKVDGTCQTSDKNVYAIGDCTYHFNEYYKRWVRLESVQNAVDQAKVAAASICGIEAAYNAIPWFWSDQFDIKLQMVGLSEGFTEALFRKENDQPDCFSVWYFKGEELLAVDAVNSAKAYVIGMKVLKNRQIIDKTKLVDSSLDLKAIIF